ncbi:carcinine hydrolase/isopenicillin-N N-acyltransferase family protein [Cecembia rubra]|uniref:Dipeptidase n=1 Tax=Cecembia rubra TaxID=1485585 RepID=A0A2P8EAU1_9BACT|nr:carcinine hydrolase/isopenicillin-N N-acyltransferase family protein [Cecembia rubra]PSL06584.1 dipeptidase [Cecembia rubra]
MCDTLVSIPNFTASGNLIFAKNSDREPDEAQALLHVPRTIHQEAYLKCTYIKIPQVKETFGIILSKPFHIWGAEMGVNEHGVVIGNEAVFTRVKIRKDNSGLNGMDLLRLALERSENSEEAIEWITQLLKRYGQDACGGYKNKDFFYHNSYLLADSKSAYILETAGKSWALKKISSIGSISNGLQIGSDYDKVHLAEEKLNFPFQYFPKPKPFSFNRYYSDFLYTTIGRAVKRQSCSLGLMQEQEGSFSVLKAMGILKTHDKAEADFDPKKANTASLCMHATGLTNPSTTTGSMVAEIRKDLPSTIWLTGTSMPCISVFIPFFLGTSTLSGFTQPNASPDDSLWWKAEKWHRWICEDYKKRKIAIVEELNQIQADFLMKEKELFSKNPELKILEAFSAECLQKVDEFYSRKLPVNSVRINRS